MRPSWSLIRALRGATYNRSNPPSSGASSTEDTNGRNAASVLPPAVGAAMMRSLSPPSRMVMAFSWTSRSSPQPLSQTQRLTGSASMSNAVDGVLL